MATSLVKLAQLKSKKTLPRVTKLQMQYNVISFTISMVKIQLFVEEQGFGSGSVSMKRENSAYRNRRVGITNTYKQLRGVFYKFRRL